MLNKQKPLLAEIAVMWSTAVVRCLGCHGSAQLCIDGQHWLRAYSPIAHCDLHKRDCAKYLHIDCMFVEHCELHKSDCV